MNNITLSGRITKDIEMKQTPSGTSVTNFCIAVDRRDKNKTTDFIDCVAWGKTAEFISKWFCKGKPIEIRGELQTRNYERQDGTKAKVTEVFVADVNFVLSDNSQPSSKATEQRQEEPMQEEPMQEEPVGEMPFEI